MPKGVVVLGFDAAGLEAALTAVKEAIEQAGHPVLIDELSGAADYPDVAERTSRTVVEPDVHSGILVCGTGIGMSIAANKMPGILAAPFGDDAAFAAFDAAVGCRGYVRVRAGRRAEARATPTPDREPDVTVPATSEPTLVGRLQDMVAEVLGTRVPPGESLTLNGSDSFAATRIAARIREAFGYGVPLRALLRADTIAQLATVVEGARGAPADD